MVNVLFKFELLKLLMNINKFNKIIVINESIMIGFRFNVIKNKLGNICGFNGVIILLIFI